MKNLKLGEIIFDIKMLNLCAWLTVLVAYITPYRIGDSGKYMYGYPFPFIQIHPLSTSRIPLLGSGLNLLMFFIDLYAIYILIKIISSIVHRFKGEQGVG